MLYHIKEIFFILFNLQFPFSFLGAEHVTDVSNASRTNLMSLHTLAWDPALLEFFGIPTKLLPKIKSNSDNFGVVSAIPSLKGVKITGCMGDQHAALVGHHCFEVGQSKNTYGTGLFLLTNIGTQVKFSNAGVLTTIAYQFGPDQKACYAMEGAIASGGHAIRWLRDNMGNISALVFIKNLSSNLFLLLRASAWFLQKFLNNGNFNNFGMMGSWTFI